MNALRQSWLRVPLIALAAFGWLAISNHCALAAFTSAPEVPSCHAQKAPVKHEKPAAVECCKVLRATLLKVANDSPRYDQSAFTFVSYSVLWLDNFADEHAIVSPLECDTGPPARSSFAESVLQRSILAHAPPSFLS